jgi:hypothetical protein
MTSKDSKKQDRVVLRRVVKVKSARRDDRETRADRRDVVVSSRAAWRDKRDDADRFLWSISSVERVGIPSRTRANATKDSHRRSARGG